MLKLLFIFCFAIMPATCFGSDSGENVILVMSDGVRWQELFDNRPDPKIDARASGQTFPLFWAKHAREGILYGNTEWDQMFISNPAVKSLPAYESIFAGETVEDCNDNFFCGIRQTTRETFAERLVASGIPKSQVVTIASWEKIARAVERRKGATTVNAGQSSFVEPDDDDHSFSEISDRMLKDPPPWENARRDEYTEELAISYLRKHRPRFLFISLNDTDEWAHHSNFYSDGYGRYLNALRRFDRFLDRLIREIDRDSHYARRTTLLVTTDHGRGNSAMRWQTHSAYQPEARKIWLYARGPHVRPLPAKPARTREHSHLDIRPTIETIMGLKGAPCRRKRGQALPEIVPPVAF